MNKENRLLKESYLQSPQPGQQFFFGPPESPAANVNNLITPKRIGLRKVELPIFSPYQSYNRLGRGSSARQRSMNQKLVQFPAFEDEQLEDPKRQTASKQPQFLPLAQLFEHVNSRKKLRQDDSSSKEGEQFINKLGIIQSHFLALENSLSEFEDQIQKQKCDKLEFLKYPPQSDQKKFSSSLGTKKDIKMNNVNDLASNLRIFMPEDYNNAQEFIQFIRCEDKDMRPMVFVQQQVTNMVGRLSQILQNQSFIRNFQQNEAPEDQVFFTFNKALNKFTRIYKCKFCPQKFNQACSLGGHISRVHKDESQKLKSQEVPKLKLKISKTRKQILNQSIQNVISK
ncbi:hypothetical protein pb186bvf_004312 [Paramecium bursaria]